MARLQLFDGPEKLREIELGERSLTIGRDESNDLVLEDASVSRRHAEIEPTGSFFLVRDHLSTNGTYVNDLLAKVRLLSSGDVIRVGRYLLRIESRPRAKESTRVRIEALAFPGESAATTGSEEGDAGPVPSASLLAGTGSVGECLRRLGGFGSRVGYAQSRPELYDLSLEFLISELGSDRASVLLLSGEGAAESPSAADLEPVAARSRAGSEGAEIIIGDGALTAALGESGALIYQISTVAGSGFAMVAPLWDRSRVRGVVYVDHAATQRPFTESDRLLFENAARLIGVSLTNAELFEGVAEERAKIRAIYSGLSDGIIVTDRDLRISECNLAATLLLGLHEGNLAGRPLFDLVGAFGVSPAPDYVLGEARDAAAIFTLVRPAAPAAAAESEGFHPTHIVGRIGSFALANGELGGFIVTLQDASELHRLDELKSRFIGDVGHKLRTPLTVIEANLPLLEESLGEPGLREELLGDIHRNAERLCHLVDQFVAFSEVELRAAGVEDAPRVVPSREVVEDAVAAVSARAESRGVAIVNDVPATSPPIKVRCALLADALARLLENGVKSSPSGSEVRCALELAGSVVKLSFTDRGPGIPPGEAEAVFELGHQVDPEGTGNVAGAGLGLTIARHVVREHGGDIRIESPVPGQERGARVTVILPTSRALSSFEPVVCIGARESGAADSSEEADHGS